LFEEPASITPSFEALRERLWRNFTGYRVPKSEHVEPLNMDLVLSPQQAARGMALHVEIPTLHPCPDCGGSGIDWGLPCERCAEGGMVFEDETVMLPLAPPIPARATREMPLEPLGIRNLRLCVHVAVSG
jgi:DnaJ-class molecular chaperone